MWDNTHLWPGPRTSNSTSFKLTAQIIEGAQTFCIRAWKGCEKKGYRVSQRGEWRRRHSVGNIGKVWGCMVGNKKGEEEGTT